jgi:hypothetical protein
LKWSGEAFGKLKALLFAGDVSVSAMRMSITEVIEVAKKFLKEDAGYERITISSVVALEPDSKWKVLAEIPGIAPQKKEVIVDDKDGNVVSYRPGQEREGAG